jgi:hypothetical protein
MELQGGFFWAGTVVASFDWDLGRVELELAPRQPEAEIIR